MPTIYRYPKQGRSRYLVVVDEDGGIDVKRGDTLDKYSMCIHGNPYMEHEYLRNKNGKLVPVENVDLIYTGETLYHIPTRKAYQQRTVKMVIPGVVIDVPPPSHYKKQQAIIKHFQRECGLSIQQAKQLSKAISVGLLAAKTAAQLAVLVGSVAMGIAAGPVVILAGFASSILALFGVLSIAHRVTGAIAYCYGVTAWVYDRAKPGFSKHLAELLERNGVHGDNLKLHHQAWIQGVAQAGRACNNITIRGSKIDPDSVKVVLRYFSKNDTTDLYRMVFKTMLEKLSGEDRNRFRKVVEKGCIYNL
ncbi:MAG: hypothetical protein V2J55_19255 [Candidatus Competibacteraceae bacterium]|jgi:hypothetical protein|nr:hypothetical protein [Candidatus Competibacteraceae bacterium]